MARSRDLLQRFRPAGAPGTAAAAGVPADHVAELTAELEPVLALLDEVTEEARRIRTEGVREASRIRTDAEQRARTTVTMATRDADDERLAIAARADERAAADAARMVAAAQEEAVALRERADPLIQQYVDRVVAQVRATLLSDTS